MVKMGGIGSGWLHGLPGTIQRRAGQSESGVAQ